jgi:hypothetical protein
VVGGRLESQPRFLNTNTIRAVFYFSFNMEDGLKWGEEEKDRN